MRFAVAISALLAIACAEPFEPAPVMLSDDMPTPTLDMTADMEPEVLEYTYDGPIVVEDFELDRNALGDPLMVYTIRNTSNFELDFVGVGVLLLDRDGAPLDSAFGEPGKKFALEENLAPGGTFRGEIDFVGWGAIKTYRFIALEADFASGAEWDCPMGPTAPGNCFFDYVVP